MTNTAPGAVTPHPWIAPQFLDRLHLVQDGVDTVSGTRWWRLTQEFRFNSSILGARLNVPAGFRTDLASVPRIPFAWWLAGGTANAAGVLHDFLYRHHLFSREHADALFYEATETDGSAVGIPLESAWRRWLMWQMLRWFGSYAFEQRAHAIRRTARAIRAR